MGDRHAGDGIGYYIRVLRLEAGGWESIHRQGEDVA
jgi:hypothetical protein